MQRRTQGIDIMIKENVFISFQYDCDRNYKNLLHAWNNNPNFEFGMYDQSVTVPINSDDASRIKAGITKKMSDSDYVLVIVGKNTHRSEWVNWEIEKAHELGKRIIAVKIDKSYKAPAALYGKNSTWAMSFKQDSIIRALNEAKRNNKPLTQKGVSLSSTTTIARCKRCGRPLTNPTSVSLGLGPLCRTKN